MPTLDECRTATNDTWATGAQYWVGAVDSGPIISSQWPTNPIAANQRDFRKLAHEWREATGGFPRVADKIKHPSYLRIISWGWDAVPHILAELQSSDDAGHWFEALHQITGADPVQSKDRGNIRKMAEAWIQWGRRRNLTA